MRKRFRSHRAALPAGAVRERSARICTRLLDELADVNTVALFWPIERKKEVDLRAADQALRERGVQIAYPAIDDEGTMRFHVVDDPSTLEMSPLGFMAPPAGAAVADALDAIVTPGLAFDVRGHRIGYGGGFYDQALSRHDRGTRRIGVAYDFQLVADIPNDERDQPVDKVVTDRRVIKAN